MEAEGQECGDGGAEARVTLDVRVNSPIFSLVSAGRQQLQSGRWLRGPPGPSGEILASAAASHPISSSCRVWGERRASGASRPRA